MPQLYLGDTPLSQMPASYPASRVTHESVSVTADGVKTWKQLFDELFLLLDLNKLTGQSYFYMNTGTIEVYAYLERKTDTFCEFNAAKISNSGYMFSYTHLEANASIRAELTNGNYSDISNYAPGVGRVFTVYY